MKKVSWKNKLIKAFMTKDSENPEELLLALDEMEEELDNKEEVPKAEKSLEERVASLEEAIAQILKASNKEVEEDLVTDEEDLLVNENSTTTDSLASVLSKATVMLPNVKFKHSTKDSVDATVLNKYKVQVLTKLGVAVGADVNATFEAEYNKARKLNNNGVIGVRTKDSTKPLTAAEINKLNQDFWSNKKG